MTFVLRWLLAFAFTQLVEAPIYALGIGTDRPRAERWALALAPSALTHPFVWLALPDLVALLPFATPPWALVVLSEAFAYGVEALYLHAHGVRHALRLAVLANTASFVLGLFLYARLGW